jgi:hypothetical protein
MSYEHQEAFQKYLEAQEQEIHAARAFLSDKTELEGLERLTHKLAFVCNTGRVNFPETSAGRTCWIVITKLTNELHSFSGALRAGSLHGAWQHVRAVIEVSAVLAHIFNDVTATARRAAQFVEFERVDEWKILRRLQAKAEALTADERVILDRLSPNAPTAEQIAAWLKLYEVRTEEKLANLKKWHKPQLTELVVNLEAKTGDPGPYSLICHTAHVSPVAYKLVGKGGARTLGYDAGMAQFAVRQMFFRAGYAINLIHSAMNVALLEHFVDEFKASESFRHFAATGKVMP